MTININGLDVTVSIMEHDSSDVGLRYKLVCVLSKRLPQRRRCYMPITLSSRPKPFKDAIGPWVLDISNAIYRSLSFRYAYNPSVSFAKGKTVFTYYFNDVNTARSLGLVMSDALYKAALKHQIAMADKEYPNFQHPYL